MVVVTVAVDTGPNSWVVSRKAVKLQAAEVCVYASAHRLRGNNYRIKIVDEAACSAAA